MTAKTGGPANTDDNWRSMVEKRDCMKSSRMFFFTKKNGCACCLIVSHGSRFGKLCFFYQKFWSTRTREIRRRTVGGKEIRISNLNNSSSEPQLTKELINSRKERWNDAKFWLRYRTVIKHFRRLLTEIGNCVRIIDAPFTCLNFLPTKYPNTYFALENFFVTWLCKSF